MEVVASQAQGVRTRTGLSEAQTEAAAWAVAESGVVGGARSMALTLAVAWQTRLPMLPWHVPGMPWLLDRLYEFIARNRRRLPGDTPWCVEHADDCEPSGGRAE